MSAQAIEVENLGKRYRLGERERYVALRDVLARAFTAPFRAFRRPSNTGQNGIGNSHVWAVRDVSFEVREGETIGVIGRNGAGKSTLLKILARITQPSEGRARIRGRVGSLLEVGTGFHPELTGRENVFLSGAILGMKKAEIVKKFDEIAAFSGVETFLDTPLKHYSSGMQMRLAFAVAAHLEPEVLLVDEVLAVGDLEFQKKCLGKMEEVTRGGRTVLFVSHNMGAVRRICGRGLWLEGGRMRQLGSAGECVDAYMANADAESEENSGVFDLRKRTDRTGDALSRIEEIRLLNSEGQPSSSFEFGEPFRVLFALECRELTRSCFVGINLLGADGTSVLGTHHYDSAEIRDLEPGMRYHISCLFEPNQLKPGRYSLQVGVLDFATWEFHDWFYSAGEFDIAAGSGRFNRNADRRPAYLQPILEWRWD